MSELNKPLQELVKLCQGCCHEFSSFCISKHPGLDCPHPKQLLSEIVEAVKKKTEKYHKRITDSVGNIVDVLYYYPFVSELDKIKEGKQ